MISSLVQLVLACVCGLRQRHRRLSRFYSYYSLGLLGISFSSLLDGAWNAWRLSQALALSLPLTSLLFFHFVSTFVNETTRARTTAIGSAYVAWTLTALSAWWESCSGLVLWIILALLGIPPAIYSIERLASRARSSFSRLEKRQLTYLAAGFSILLLGCGLDLLLRSNFAFSAIGLLALALSTSISILRYKFLDLPVSLGRSMGILVVAYLLWSIYSEIVFWFSSTYNDLLGSRAVSIFLLAMATGVILMLFDPIKKTIMEQWDRVLTRESYAFQRELTALSSSLISVLDLMELFAKVLQELSSSPRVAHVEIFLTRPQTEDFLAFSPSSAMSARRLEQESPLVRLLAQEHRVLVLDELERSVQLFYPSDQQRLIASAALQLRQLGGELVVPLRFQNKLSGFIILASAKETGLFTAREREILLSLAGQLAITVENARIYDQMRQHDRLVAVGEMATGLAHEIRNPLASIKAAAQYIQPGMVGKEDREFLSILIEEVDRLNNVVTRFLDYARPLQIRLSTHNFNQIVQRVVTLMAPEAASRQIEISAQLDASLPEMFIDGEQLRQVLLNLILNAIEAIPENSGGEVRVATHFIPAQGNENLGEAVLRIEDTGQGIPEGDRDKVFHPFYTTKSSGTGLGLAIAYRIVQAHEGEISVQSEVGLGTTFEIKLPIKADPEAEEALLPIGVQAAHAP